MYDFSPNYTKLKPFRCLCYPWLRPYSTSKLHPRSTPCLFLGYSTAKSSYKYIHLETRRIYHSRHVEFVEDHFPYKTSQSPSTSLPTVDEFFTHTSPTTYAPISTPTSSPSEPTVPNPFTPPSSPPPPLVPPTTAPTPLPSSEPTPDPASPVSSSRSTPPSTMSPSQSPTPSPTLPPRIENPTQNISIPPL